MKKNVTLLCVLLLSSLLVNAQKFRLARFSVGYSNPVGIENCGDTRLFIVEQEGKIFICDSAGIKDPVPFLDITDRVLFDGERGLLGLAFDPKFSVNSFFYVYYINKSGNTQVSRFKVKTDSPNVAAKGSEKYILSIKQPFSKNKGGCIRFGSDGYLYIGTGDGGGSGDPHNKAQNPQSLLGKMLRIDVHSGSRAYKVPSDNPFVDSSGYKKEIWALGLRNPWRWSFDDLNGQMYIGDVGKSAWEEVDVELPGAGGHNYGWRCYEGKQSFDTTGCLPKNNYTAPRYAYPHNDSVGGDCSVTGGFVYRGSKFPLLYGKYVFTDYCSGLFRLLYKEGGQSKARIVYDGDDNAYTSFGEDMNHELYVCNAAKGFIYQIKYGTAQSENFSDVTSVDSYRLSFSPNPSNGQIHINYSSARAERISIHVTGLMGNIVYSNARTVNAGSNNWNENLHIPSGNYILSITTNSGKVISQSLRIE
jgi:glucose/arabinose dehydrogenase